MREQPAGEIKNFTGIDSPYETPERPELHLTPSAARRKTCHARSNAGSTAQEAGAQFDDGAGI